MLEPRKQRVALSGANFRQLLEPSRESYRVARRSCCLCRNLFSQAVKK